MLKIVFLACVIAGAAFASPVYADAVSDGVAAMPGGVQDVRYSGTWNRDGRSGVYRIVTVQSSSAAATDRLFVQWVAHGNVGQLTVTNSIEINEIAAGGLDIVNYMTQSDSEGLVVFIDVVDPRTSLGEEYELFVFAPNEYRLGTSTN